MPLFRRLLLCLLALALLPGAMLQAPMAVAMPAVAHEAAPMPTATATGSGCHEAVPVESAAPTGGARHADHDEGSAGDCCGDASAGGCSEACACPTALPALPLAAMATARTGRDPRWSAGIPHGRDRFAEGPPKRPPIG